MDPISIQNGLVSFKGLTLDEDALLSFVFSFDVKFEAWPDAVEAIDPISIPSSSSSSLKLSGVWKDSSESSTLIMIELSEDGTTSSGAVSLGGSSS